MSDVNDYLSDAKSNYKQSNSHELENKNLSAVLKEIVKTECGKILFEELRRIYLDVGIWTYGQDNNLIYFREGQRQVVLYLLNLLSLE